MKTQITKEAKETKPAQKMNKIVIRKGKIIFTEAPFWIKLKNPQSYARNRLEKGLNIEKLIDSMFIMSRPYDEYIILVKYEREKVLKLIAEIDNEKKPLLLENFLLTK